MDIMKRAMSGATKGVTIKGGSSSRGYGGATSTSFFGHYTSETYASAYPSIRAISTEYMAVRPYAIDGNGKPVDHAVVDALYHPNQTDSSIAFAEKVAVATLALHKTYLLVWSKEKGKARPGGNFGTGGKNIIGFTFLERPIVTRKEGRTYYKIGQDEYTDQEVIVLPGGVDPNNLYAGYSPSEAARRWIKLDDYIADYQAGFFENGAVPAGQFIISATSSTDYEDIVRQMKNKHGGAGKNNNVTYSHRLINETGGTVATQIEWKPFAQSNKDIDFKNLFEQTNRRIDVAYGVPAIIKGVDSDAKYDNAEVAERGFAKRAVNPLLLRNYAQITHELNRITGGLGVAITYDYEIPQVADQEKVVADTNKTRVETIKELLDMGYSLDSIVDALELSPRFKLLKKGEEAPVIVNDKPEVDEGNEVQDAPNPDIVGGYSYTRSATEVAKSTNPKAPNGTKQLTNDDLVSYQEQLDEVILSIMQRQIDRTIDQTKAIGDVTEEDDEDLTEEIMAIMLLLLLVSGRSEYATGLNILTANSIPLTGTSQYILSDATVADYRVYLAEIVHGYNLQTQASIQSVLAQAQVNNWSTEILHEELRAIIVTDAYRVTRLSLSESHRAMQIASMAAIAQLMAETSTVFNKVWRTTSGNACQFCIMLDGKVVETAETFFPVGDTMTAPDGTVMINTFLSVEHPPLHPNCQCVLVWEVIA